MTVTNQLSAKKARDKKKKEDDDEEKKKATPKRIKKVQKGGKKTPSPKTTEKTIRKTTKTTGAKKNASEKVITFGDWLSSYISGSKKINLKKLKSGVEMNFTDGSSTVTLAPFQVLQTVAPHLFTTEDQTALTRAGNYPPIDGAGGCTIC